MTETEIIKLVFGLFLGVGGGVLLLLAFTVGYRYLVMEQRCTCRTNGTVTGYSAVCYGGAVPSAHPLRGMPAAAMRKTASCTSSAAAILSSE